MITQVQVWYALLLSFFIQRKSVVVVAAVAALIVATMAFPETTVFAGNGRGGTHCPGC